MIKLKNQYLSEIEDCESCPLPRFGLCNCNFSYPSSPLGYKEPPCASWDGDMCIDDYVQAALNRQVVYENIKEQELKKELKKKKEVELAKKRREYLKWYCLKEAAQVKHLKKIVKDLEEVKSYANIYSEAVNFTNECFRYTERIKPNPEIDKALRFAKSKLSEAELTLKLKKEEGRKTPEYKAL